LSEGKGAIPVYLVLESLLADRLRNYVNPGAEHLRKASFQLFQTPEIIETATGKAFAEADRDIDIGIRPGAAARSSR
jgi:hypothetical protein